MKKLKKLIGLLDRMIGNTIEQRLFPTAQYLCISCTVVVAHNGHHGTGINVLNMQDNTSQLLNAELPSPDKQS